MNEIRPNQPRGTSAPRFDDEIDLIDLAVALWRRKWVVIAFSLLGVVLGAAVPAVQEQRFEVSAVLAVGKLDSGELVQSTSTVKNWLESSLLPAAAKFTARDTSVSPGGIGFTVKNGEGESVLIQAQAPEALVEPHMNAINWAAERVADIADKPIRNLKSDLRSDVRTLELELERIQDKDRLTGQRLALEQKLNAKRSALSLLLDHEMALNEQLDRLNTLRQLQSSRAEEINAYLDRIRLDDESMLSASSPNDAMTAMLLSNQVQRYMDRLAALNQEITVELPRKISAVQTELAEIKHQQGQLKTDIEQAKLELKTFNTDHEREVRQLTLAIGDKKARLENIQETGLLTAPQKKLLATVSPNLSIVLGAILGLFAGLFAALMVGFVSAARERLHETESTED